MDLNPADVRVIRAPSLKRGKSDNGLNERVSPKASFLICLYSLFSHFLVQNLRGQFRKKKVNFKKVEKSIIVSSRK